MITLKQSDICRMDNSIMLSGRGISAITGEPEFSVTVLARDEEFSRNVAKVFDPVKNLELWADTITGTLYRENGIGLSSAVRFESKPKSTGRNVPDKKQRAAEIVSLDFADGLEAA